MIPSDPSRRIGETRLSTVVMTSFASCLLSLVTVASVHAKKPTQASVLPDLSGMSWIGGDQFLAVHDAKNAGEAGNPRVSILTLPQDLKGVLFTNAPVSFKGPKSNDLESTAWIPGTNEVLMLESGDDLGDPTFQRIFKARVSRGKVSVVAVTEWPEPIMNVEGSAVARLSNGQYVFVYAERAQNQSSTQLRSATFDPETLEFDEFQSVTFNAPDPVAYNRPLVAMDIDSAGRIFIASAFDAEAAGGYSNPDNGPFASAVYLIGMVVPEEQGAKIQLSPPILEGILDGLKVESIALRETDDEFQIFVGVDDENYGGTLRMLPPLP